MIYSDPVTSKQYGGIWVDARNKLTKLEDILAIKNAMKIGSVTAKMLYMFIFIHSAIHQ